MIILEWLAFGGALVSTFLYGNKHKTGPIAGMVVAFLFILYGWLETIPAAIISNIVFFVLHCRNYLRFNVEDIDKLSKRITKEINYLSSLCYQRSFESGWYIDVATDKPRETDIPKSLCLIHSEISEALEAHRKDLRDEKLPHRSGLEVELADAIIRICDLAGSLNLNLGAALAEKLEYNRTRPDHKLENRKKGGGKKY